MSQSSEKLTHTVAHAHERNHYASSSGPGTPRNNEEYGNTSAPPVASAAAALAQLHSHKVEPDWDSEGVRLPPSASILAYVLTPTSRNGTPTPRYTLAACSPPLSSLPSVAWNTPLPLHITPSHAQTTGFQLCSRTARLTAPRPFLPSAPRRTNAHANNPSDVTRESHHISATSPVMDSLATCAAVAMRGRP